MSTNIKLNGKGLTIYGTEVSFLDVQRMAAMPINTVTYSWQGEGDLRREGILGPTDKPVKVADGMIFNAVYIP